MKKGNIINFKDDNDISFYGYIINNLQNSYNMYWIEQDFIVLTDIFNNFYI